MIVAVVKIPCQQASNEANRGSTIGLTEEVKEDKIKTFAMILHEGPVLRARCNPFRENQIATKSEDGQVHIYDYFDHRKDGKELSTNTMHLRLKGLKPLGFGLTWNHKKEGIIMSCDNEGQVLLWDINKLEEKRRDVNYRESFKFHEKSVGDISAHRFHSDFFMTGDDEGKLAL